MFFFPLGVLLMAVVHIVLELLAHIPQSYDVPVGIIINFILSALKYFVRLKVFSIFVLNKV